MYEGLLERTVKRVGDVTFELDSGAKAKSPRVTLAEMESARLDGTARVAELLKERSERSGSAIRNALEGATDDRLAARLLTVCRGDIDLRDRILPYPGSASLLLRPDATVAEACTAMHQRRVGAVIIVEDGDRLVGIFTGRDAVRCLAEACDARNRSVAQVITRNPTTLLPEHHAIDALRHFNDCGFRHLPICRDGRVCGIVSRYDFRSMEHARLDEETRFFEVLR